MIEVVDCADTGVVVVIVEVDDGVFVRVVEGLVVDDGVDVVVVEFDD